MKPKEFPSFAYSIEALKCPVCLDLDGGRSRPETDLEKALRIREMMEKESESFVKRYQSQEVGVVKVEIENGFSTVSFASYGRYACYDNEDNRLRFSALMLDSFLMNLIESDGVDVRAIGGNVAIDFLDTLSDKGEGVSLEIDWEEKDPFVLIYDSMGLTEPLEPIKTFKADNQKGEYMRFDYQYQEYFLEIYFGQSSDAPLAYNFGVAVRDRESYLLASKEHPLVVFELINEYCDVQGIVAKSGIADKGKALFEAVYQTN